MDSDTSVEELKREVKEFCEERNWSQYHDAKELSIGLATEASELLEHFRFKSEEEVDRMFEDGEKAEELRHEMADVFYFLLRMAQFYDIDLSEAMEQKMEWNRDKYPVEKARDSNKKYTEFD